MRFQQTLQALLADLSHFPWRYTALTLRDRFREDRMGLTASSLTFTTSIALVPFFTVALAVFTAFPMFSKLQDALQAWLIQSLIPDNIARQVLGYLTQFSPRPVGNRRDTAHPSWSISRISSLLLQAT